MLQSWLLNPQHYDNGKVEAYIIWYVNEPASCNHFVLSAPGRLQRNGTTEVMKRCNDDGAKRGVCLQRFDILRQWTYYDPATEDGVVQPRTFDEFPSFGEEMLNAYMQGYQYNPNKDGPELLAAIIATKGLKKDFPCTETSYGKDHQLPQKEGCARSKQSARPK